MTREFSRAAFAAWALLLLWSASPAEAIRTAAKYAKDTAEVAAALGNASANVSVVASASADGYAAPAPLAVMVSGNASAGASVDSTANASRVAVPQGTVTEPARTNLTPASTATAPQGSSEERAVSIDLRKLKFESKTDDQHVAYIWAFLAVFGTCALLGVAYMCWWQPRQSEGERLSVRVHVRGLPHDLWRLRVGRDRHRGVCLVVEVVGGRRCG
eukprot:CAMPEP_0115546336 /NCGR_PEP_ID=MMETSP0271-20121206/93077_1 /TAXON_ID=71861 /ORGANISM="Scrippsiella trochoidea, Strain CCMP3099" /LENGTH=215 /DNA_ID=CAMNT_0002979731 /DNA_START=67 /DNA_END=710 /DNA_ORIENTATION=+